VIISGAGGLVVPGLMDEHVHFLSGGYQLSSVDLKMRPPTGIHRADQSLRRSEAGEWILGGDWDQGGGLARRCRRASGSTR
jgi:predicted amidohydrolase YtcJ